MTQSYIAQGDTLTLLAPSGGVTPGTPLLIGGLVVIPKTTAAEAASFDAYVTGVHSVPKANSQAWTQGCVVYWDASGGAFTTASTSNYRAGVAVEAGASTAGLTTGKVRLNGVGVTAVAGVAP